MSSGCGGDGGGGGRVYLCVPVCMDVRDVCVSPCANTDR